MRALQILHTVSVSTYHSSAWQFSVRSIVLLFYVSIGDTERDIFCLYLIRLLYKP
jgi:hypothetical protein